MDCLQSEVKKLESGRRTNLLPSGSTQTAFSSSRFDLSEYVPPNFFVALLRQADLDFMWSETVKTRVRQVTVYHRVAHHIAVHKRPWTRRTNTAGAMTESRGLIFVMGIARSL